MPARRPPLTARDDTGADWRRTTHLRQALTLARALHGRTVSEAAELAGLPLATAYRALAALKAAGSELVHVERDDAGRYRVRVLAGAATATENPSTVDDCDAARRRLLSVLAARRDALAVRATTATPATDPRRDEWSASLAELLAPRPKRPSGG